MALDFSKMKELLKPITEFKFSSLNSRSRIIVIVVGMIGIVLAMYFISTYFFGGAGEGAASVPSAPSNLKTIPGAKVTPEYERIIKDVEKERVRRAEMTGESAIGSISNTNNASGQCNIICSDQSVNVKTTLDDWSRRGDISDAVAADLLQLANKQVSVDEYAARLNELVKQGKLTPEQARELLAQYKKQYANGKMQESAKLMDGMIQAGDLPLDIANQLLTMQKDGASASQYAAYLNQAVTEGKLSASAAQKLLAQYKNQQTRKIIDQSIAFIQQLVRDGKLVKEVADPLIELENKFVPLDDFSAAVQKFTDAGKLIPATAKLLTDEYVMQKTSAGSGETAISLLQKAEAAAFAELDDLEAKKRLTKEVADQVRGMIRSNVSLSDFEATIAQLVQQNKMTPEIAKLKIADYRLVKSLRDLSRDLNAAQANNASADAYADILKQGVQNGAITPEEAARLMREYQASLMTPGAGAATATATTEAFAQMQKEVAEATPTESATTDQFAVANTEAQQASEQDKQALIQNLMGVMSGQAQQLISSWQAPVMQVKAGVVDRKRELNVTVGKDTGAASGTNKGTAIQAAVAPVLVKAGAILFAVLDTAVNSDYPDSPVMATVVQGPYKGAKLLGKLTTAKSVTGQMDRIALNFTVMNTDAWPKSKAVTAFAIDPDSAKTVLASEVNYHYLQRFGAAMATSFVQGYADAIKSSGGQISQTGLSTTTANPALSPSQKVAVGIGKIGEILGDATQNYINIPPTVKIDAGVGIGILFMADLT